MSKKVLDFHCIRWQRAELSCNPNLVGSQGQNAQHNRTRNKVHMDMPSEWVSGPTRTAWCPFCHPQPSAHNVLMQTQGEGGGVVSRTSQRLTTSSFSGLQNQHIFMYNQAENAHIHKGAKYRKTHFKHYSQIFLQPLNKFKLFIFNVLLFFSQ